MLIFICDANPSQKDKSNGFAIQCFVVFFILGTLFLIVGVLIIAEIKKNFNEFYDAAKKPIMFATGFLAISTYLRSVLDLMMHYKSSELFK